MSPAAQKIAMALDALASEIADRNIAAINVGSSMALAGHEPYLYSVVGPTGERGVSSGCRRCNVSAVVWVDRPGQDPAPSRCHAPPPVPCEYSS